MKKVIVLGIIGLMVVSCKKENIVEIPKDVESVYKNGGPTLRIFYNNGGPVEGKDFGCAMSGGNCLDDIDVSNYDPALHAILEAFMIFWGISGDPVDPFTTYYDEFVQIFGAGLVDSVINGSVNLTIKGNLEGENKCYFIFKNATDNTIVVVYPFFDSE